MKNKLKKYRFLFVSALAGMMFALLLTQISGCSARDKTEVLELTTPFFYDETVEEMLEKARTDGISLVFWKEQAGTSVANQDYNRLIQVKAYGIAGSSGVLFPESNSLSAGETGYCLLGEDTAWELFGSTEVIGRKVTVGEKCYQVAGIEYQEPELFIYELETSEGAELTHAAYRYNGTKEKELVGQKLSGTYGVVGVEE